jgi:hypothetical protein
VSLKINFSSSHDKNELINNVRLTISNSGPRMGFNSSQGFKSSLHLLVPRIVRFHLQGDQNNVFSLLSTGEDILASQPDLPDKIVVEYWHPVSHQGERAQGFL